jgi:hypothetical protein
MGRLPLKAVVAQIKNLPECSGRKIPFELIDENPLPLLPRLLAAVSDAKLRLSHVNLVTRADWLVNCACNLTNALRLAKQMDVQIRLVSLGFESFKTRLLDHFNKGTTLEINLAAVQLIRQLKVRFPQNWAYSHQEGCNHGFIHPTPWDKPEEWMETEAIIQRYGLQKDILPKHSLPLIIHHASPLGTWLRAVEHKTGMTYPRQNSWIAWWEEPRTAL